MQDPDLSGFFAFCRLGLYFVLKSVCFADMAKQQIQFDDDLMGDTPVLRALSKEHEEFCQAVVATGNPSEAYRQTVATSPDVKPGTVWSRSSELMARSEVQARIRELKQEAARYAHVTPGKIMAELGKIAFFDIRKTLDANGNMLPIQDLDDDTAAGIAGVEFKLDDLEIDQKLDDDGNVEKTRTRKTTTAKVKLADKRAALTDLSKLIGMQVDKVEHSGPDGTPLIPNSDTEVARRVAYLLAQGMKEKDNG